MYIDLHTHSYFSDGAASPQEIITEAKKGNVSILSITDHNFIADTKIIKKCSKENDIEYIEGIEISTLRRGLDFTTSLHILGYGKKLNKNLLNRRLQKTVAGYNERALAIVKKLNKIFPKIALDFQLLKNSCGGAYVSRNTLAKLVVAHLKKSISLRDALKEYVFVKEDDSWMMTPEESMNLIIEAGGVPVLAHSGRILRNMGIVEYEKMIVEFVKAGLSGIEVYFPKHTEAETNALRRLASKFKLYITGGSDWHGKVYTPKIKIGVDLPRQDVVAFLNDKKIKIVGF